jgi:hypothetical protein
VVDPDDTTQHAYMERVKEYARKEKKELASLTHSEIVEATGDESALVRWIRVERILKGLEGLPEGLDPISTPIAVKGVTYVDHGKSS